MAFHNPTQDWSHFFSPTRKYFRDPNMYLLSPSRSAITLFGTLILAIACQMASFADEPKPEIGSTAGKRLQGMSEYIGGLKRFSVDVLYSVEIQREGREKKSRSEQRHVVLE